VSFSGTVDDGFVSPRCREHDGGIRRWPLRRANSMADSESPNRGGIDMRHLVLAIVMAAGVSLIGSVGASAAPVNGHAIAQAADQASYTVEVRGGCGRGWHRGPHGGCRRNW
jgi:hypothetical protein